MKRSMSRQAEAERERRARIITADGEYQASKRLAAAANVMARDPAALQLRLLQTVVEVAAERNSTLVMPIPVELLRFFDKFTPSSGAGGTQSAADSASMADFGDAVDPAIADAVAEAEGKKPISAPAAESLEIPEVPAIPELSATEKGDIGTLSEGAPPVGQPATPPKEAPSNGTAPEPASRDTGSHDG
jgi:hypothetical protein